MSICKRFSILLQAYFSIKSYGSHPRGGPAKGGGSRRGTFGRYLETGAWNSEDEMNSRDLEAICVTVKAEEADDLVGREEKQSALRPAPWETR